MGYLPSARKQVSPTANQIVPDSAQTPAAHTHFLTILNATESRLVLRVPSIAQVTTAPYSVAPLEDGMLVVTTSAPFEIYLRCASAWKKIWPMIYNGTTAPSAGLGADDDLYILY